MISLKKLKRRSTDFIYFKTIQKRSLTMGLIQASMNKSIRKEKKAMMIQMMLVNHTSRRLTTMNINGR